MSTRLTGIRVDIRGSKVSVVGLARSARGTSYRVGGTAVTVADIRDQAKRDVVRELVAKVIR